MEQDVEKRIAYYRSLLIESFMKEDEVRYEYACKGLRQLLSQKCSLPVVYKRKYKKELNHLTKKGRHYFSEAEGMEEGA